ncbi:MAG TPA: hypothetical protein VG456_20370 [Candidatus Sulfopaludibacter sp.]|jgi:hypothetical protein|nr:hypothetical protein [Candidatus Sulfopaludibacter sp.]
MKTTCFLAALALVPAWAQVVKPTAGALAPTGSTAPAVSAPASTVAAKPAGGTVPTGVPGIAPAAFRRIESDFDAQLKMADPKDPINVLGLTRGLYVPGFGVVFTTEVELAQNNVNPLFTHTITTAAKTGLHENKAKHVDLLRKQMSAMMANSAKNLTFLGPNDQVVVAVRLYYDSWEDRSGLPEQIVMRADRRGAQSGDIKVEVQ